MTTTWTPWVGERIPSAWRLALDALADLEWHDRATLSETIAAQTGLLPETIREMLRSAVRFGVLGRRRSYRKFRPVEVRLRPDAPAWALSPADPAPAGGA